MCLLLPFQWSTFWSAVSALFTALGAIFTGAVVFAIFIAAKQLRFDAYLKAEEIWTDHYFTKGRGRVFSRLDKLDSDWTDDEEENALQVCRKLDEFACGATQQASQLTAR
jgi:hypothetical protein